MDGANWTLGATSRNGCGQAATTPILSKLEAWKFSQVCYDMISSWRDFNRRVVTWKFNT